MNEIFDKDTIEALKKLATGLIVTEITKEYAKDDNGDLQLIKKKVNEKMLPPNTDIMKMLYQSSKENNSKYKDMTDEQLLEEKQRLLEQLKNEI